MGWLEDMLLGAPSGPDYSRLYYNLSPEERRKVIEARMKDYQRNVRNREYPDIQLTPLGEKLFSNDPESFSKEQQESFDRYQPKMTPSGLAKEKVEAFAAQKEANKQTKQADTIAKALKIQAEKDLLKEANLSSLRSVEELPADKLVRIKAQARAKGRGGSLGANIQPNAKDYAMASFGKPSGSFSQQEMSPELAARLRERDAWAAEQPLRNMEYMTTPEQARRHPEIALGAAEAITQMKRQRESERMQDIQMAFVQKLAGNNGTIPRDQAVQLQAMGIQVPYSAIGSSRDDGIQFFDQAIRAAGEGLQGMDPLMVGPDNPRVKFERYGAMRAQDYKQKIAQGMNPDDAMTAFRQEMAEMAMAFGLINIQQGQLPQAQPQGQ